MLGTNCSRAPITAQTVAHGTPMSQRPASENPHSQGVLCLDDQPVFLSPGRRNSEVVSEPHFNGASWYLRGWRFNKYHQDAKN